MTISFSQIPSLVLTPGTYIELDASRMLSGLPRPRTRCLVVGQKLAAGTATAGQLIRVLGDVHARAAFGQGSMLADQLISFMKNDPSAEVWAVALADVGGGTAATGTFAFTGTATAAGTVALMVGDSRVKVPVTSGMTATQVGAAAAAAINLLLDLPVTTANNTGTVTATARHKGTVMNGYYLGYNYDPGDVLPAGIGLTATAVGGVVAGASDPDATAIFTAIGDEPFAFIIHPWTDSTNLGVFETACKARADAMTMNYSMALTVKADSYANLITLGGNRNSEFSVVAGLKGSPSPAWKIGAALGAAVFFWSRNNLGCPFTNIVLKGILAPAVADRFDREDRQFLLEAGISTLKVDSNGDVVIERMVTTRKTNAQGFADAGLRNLNTMLLWFYLNWSRQARIAAVFPNYGLGDDGNDYSPGTRIVTPSQVRGELVALAVDWHQAGLIENIDAYKASIRVERNANDRDRVDAFDRPDFINEFNVLAVLTQPIL